MVMMLGLKALNIPYSFFSEDFTNFYGSRGAVMHYIRSCAATRRANVDFLHHLLEWRITKWIIDGYLELPKGYDVRKIQWEIAHRNIPLWDTSKEMRGQSEQIAAGLDCPQNVAAELGTDFHENLERNKEALKAYELHGLPLPPYLREGLMPDYTRQEEKNGKN